MIDGLIGDVKWSREQPIHGTDQAIDHAGR
jgi:hypothetical protein